MRLFAIAWLAAIVLTHAAGAEPEPTEPVDVRAERAADANRIICDRVRITGTNFRTRVCKTQAEWNRAGGVRGGREFDFQRAGPYENAGPAPR